MGRQRLAGQDTAPYGTLPVWDKGSIRRSYASAGQTCPTSAPTLWRRFYEFIAACAALNKGQAFADKPADKLQSGIRDGRQRVSSAASSASNKVEAMRGAVGPAIDNASDNTQSLLGQGTRSDAARKAQDFASDAQVSIVTYTRQKPVKALLIAAAAGAALITLMRAFSSSHRDS